MKWLSWKALDGLLRGATKGDSSQSQLDFRALLAWQVLLAAVYGLCLGFFALSARESPDARFLLGAAAKLPVLILGATLVTFPSLYVFLALFDVPLSFRQVLGGMLAANTVFATVIASLGPIVGFFSLSSQSYAFILLLNVAICGLGGFLAMRLVVKALADKPKAESAPARVNAPPLPTESTGETAASASDSISKTSPLPQPSGRVGILGVWMVLYAFVGTQLAWILRPFIGHPEAPFVWFRGKSGSFVDTVLRALGEYLGISR